jgi:hypothetical protein
MIQTPLRDIGEVPALSPEDSECIEEIAAVLRKHGRLERFGVTLLHQHFEIAADEILMEECDPETRTLTIVPTPRAELSNLTFKETSWRLDSGKPVMSCACRVDPDTGSHNHYHIR